MGTLVIGGDSLHFQSIKAFKSRFMPVPKIDKLVKKPDELCRKPKTGSDRKPPGLNQLLQKNIQKVIKCGGVWIFRQS